jgi:hypothetical protein
MPGKRVDLIWQLSLLRGIGNNRTSRGSVKIPRPGIDYFSRFFMYRSLNSLFSAFP